MLPCLIYLWFCWHTKKKLVYKKKGVKTIITGIASLINKIFLKLIIEIDNKYCLHLLLFLGIMSGNHLLLNFKIIHESTFLKNKINEVFVIKTVQKIKTLIDTILPLYKYICN